MYSFGTASHICSMTVHQSIASERLVVSSCFKAARAAIFHCFIVCLAFSAPGPWRSNEMFVFQVNNGTPYATRVNSSHVGREAVEKLNEAFLCSS
eukprot:4875802-Pleurochrysis_carterae.AAC.1